MAQWFRELAALVKGLEFPAPRGTSQPPTTPESVSSTTWYLTATHNSRVSFQHHVVSHSHPQLQV